MITDLPPMRNAQYHRVGDTPERLDYVRMAWLCDALVAVISEERR